MANAHATATRAVKSSDRPAATLDIAPEVKSVDDLNLALREMAFLAAHKATVNAARAEALAELNARFDEHLTVDFDGNLMAYDLREANLLDAIECFADREFSAVRAGDKKRSVTFAAGKIGWRKAHDAVAYLEDASAKTVISAIDRALAAADESGRGLAKRLADFTQRTKVTLGAASVPLAALIKIEPSVEKSRLLESFESRLIDEETLTLLGLAHATGEDYFEAKSTGFEPPELVA